MKSYLLSLLLLILAGCGKPDEIAPVIDIISPTNNQVFTGGQTIMVKATITDNYDIHMVHAIAIDNYGGHMLHFEEHWDGKTYNLSQSIPTAAGRSYSIEIQATDHAENVTTKTLTVTTN